MEPIKDKHIIKGHDKHSALTTYLRIAIIAIAILFQLFLMGIGHLLLRTKVVPIYILLDLAAMITVFGLINPA